mgnify:FL=1
MHSKDSNSASLLFQERRDVPRTIMSFLELPKSIVSNRRGTVLPPPPHPIPSHKIIMAQSKRWCFTLNNYDDDHLAFLRTAANSCAYLVFGREVGASGTPHLQGFVIFKSNQRLAAARRLLPGNPHLEVARGTSEEASLYCKKDGDFEEFGQLPAAPGKTNRFAEFKEWVINHPHKPTPAEIALEWESIYLCYGRCIEWVDLIYPISIPMEGFYRPYQQRLADELEQPPDSRKIHFVVDIVGNTGKSWFIKKFFADHPDDTQILSIGKRDDLAHSINPAKRFFLFDLPRSGCEYMQYSILEQLKDRFVFSPKYHSRTKVLEHLPHVVVFMNERPDMNKLSADRYQITNWLSL